MQRRAALLILPAPGARRARLPTHAPAAGASAAAAAAAALAAA
eukprot:COSAG01_NODE_4162_length_5279_cov_33.245560_5_plen_42_part_01